MKRFFPFQRAYNRNRTQNHYWLNKLIDFSVFSPPFNFFFCNNRPQWNTRNFVRNPLFELVPFWQCCIFVGQRCSKLSHQKAWFHLSVDYGAGLSIRDRALIYAAGKSRDGCGQSLFSGWHNWVFLLFRCFLLIFRWNKCCKLWQAFSICLVFV